MTYEEAIKKAEEAAFQASYLSETANNPGLKAANNNKADWLHRVVRLAEKGLEALREQEERTNPQPLTLFEMLELDGEPVWTETIGIDRTGRWELITCETVCACPLEQKLRSVTWAGDVEWYPLETYGKTWIAYRHKPEEVQG